MYCGFSLKMLSVSGDVACHFMKLIILVEFHVFEKAFFTDRSYSSADESITDQVLNSFTTMTNLSCRLKHTAGRDGTLFALCKASLPPKYLVRILGGTSGYSVVATVFLSSTSQDKNNASGAMILLSLLEMRTTKLLIHGCDFQQQNSSMRRWIMILQPGNRTR